MAGNRSLIGMRLESNLGAGSQKIPIDPRQLRYGVSVTDPYVDWETTERMLRYAPAQIEAETAIARARMSIATQRHTHLVLHSWAVSLGHAQHVPHSKH